MRDATENYHSQQGYIAYRCAIVGIPFSFLRRLRLCFAGWRHLADVTIYILNMVVQNFLKFLQQSPLPLRLLSAYRQRRYLRELAAWRHIRWQN
jgi:hypothetical protein